MNTAFVAFYTISLMLLIGIVTAFVVMVASLVALVVRWKAPTRRRHANRVLIALVAIPCLFGIQQAIQWLIFVPALGRQQMAEINAARAQKLAETSVVQLGDAVPQFTLTTADGDEFSLPDDGQVTLINFFATWCGPCQIELPHIERIWAANKDHEGFRVLVIGREETPEAVREYRDENSFSFPIAADPDGAVYSIFAKEAIPRTLVVSTSGQIVYSKVGFDEADLVELEAVLQEQLASVE